MRNPFAGRFGWLLTVLVVVAGLGGFAVWWESGGPDLEDRSGLVREWRFLAHEEVRLVGPAEGHDVAVEISEKGKVVDVYWSARPCAVRPDVVVVGTASELAIIVDRNDTRGCDSSSEPYQMHIVLATAVAPAAVTAELSE